MSAGGLSGWTLAVPADMAAELRHALQFEVETAWVLGARQAGARLLLARELFPVPEHAYRRREARLLEITSPGFVPAFGCVADDRGVAVFVHTHPGSSPVPSPRDDVVEAQLRQLAATRTRRDLLGAVVLGGTPMAPRIGGRVWRGENAEPLRALRVAGPESALLLAEGTEGVIAPVFDRQVRAFGVDGQRLLGQMRVGVVGAGGTGSAVVELLARLGVGVVVVVDDDAVEATNVTRIHESRVADAGLQKVDVAKAAAEAFGTGTQVEPVTGRATTAAAVAKLAACDVVFGCTDDHAGRLVLSRLAYQYLVPVIDCGVHVSARDGQVLSVDGRVTFVAPGEPCLLCRGQVEPRRAAEEMMDHSERARLVDEGYAAGIDQPDPAVVAFTTATSAFAVNEMLARFLAYGTTPPPGQLLLRLHERKIRVAGRAARDGCRCGDRGTWALGDTEPPLELVGVR